MMARKGQQSKAALKLAALREDPPAQRAYALELLAPQHGREAVQAALAILGEDMPEEGYRPLKALYLHYLQSGVRGDPGGYLRAEIIRLLRPWLRQEDAGWLAKAALTFEFPPPTFQEEGALLRASALVALNDVDEEAARYRAAALLLHEHTDPMSGEPARTAAVVLANLDELAALVAYVLQPVEKMAPEVGAECLRQLASVPDAGLEVVLAHYGEVEQPLLIVGLAELLMTHKAGQTLANRLAQLLHTSDDRDVYRYIASALLAQGVAWQRDLLLMEALGVQERWRAAVLLEVLELAKNDESVDKARLRLASIMKQR
jgi:hypothetical protein